MNYINKNAEEKETPCAKRVSEWDLFFSGAKEPDMETGKESKRGNTVPTIETIVEETTVQELGKRIWTLVFKKPRGDVFDALPLSHDPVSGKVVLLDKRIPMSRDVRPGDEVEVEFEKEMEHYIFAKPRKIVRNVYDFSATKLKNAGGECVTVKGKITRGGGSPKYDCYCIRFPLKEMIDKYGFDISKFHHRYALVNITIMPQYGSDTDTDTETEDSTDSNKKE